MTMLLERVSVPLGDAEPGFDIEITPDVVDGEVVYMARHPELPGCTSHGATPDEAASNLADAREMYLNALEDSGLPVPEPHHDQRVIVATVHHGERAPAASGPIVWHVRVRGGNEMVLTDVRIVPKL